MHEAARINFDKYVDEKREHIGSVIHDLWISKDESVWAREPYFYAKLGTIADGLGQVMFAHDVLSEGLSYFPDDVRLSQLYALSSVKCGFLIEARDLLQSLYDRGHRDEETLGILGRTFKEMWQIAGDDALDNPLLRRSRNLYLRAFLRSHGYYSGINAATLSFILGDTAMAENLAMSVSRVCTKIAKRDGLHDYWLAATLGEASILLGQRSEALHFYYEAKKLVGTNFADLASMRRQLKLLREATPIAAEVIEGINVPPVVAFTGHLVDAPGRRPERLPDSNAGEIKSEIAAALSELDAHIGYSSAAAGSDVLFLEALQELGGESNVVLPFDRESFFGTSVRYAGSDWERRALAAIDKSASVDETAQGRYGRDDLLFTHANRIIMGKVILRSRFLETEPILLAVWDGRQTRERGGTYEFVRRWEESGYPRRIIDIETHRRSSILDLRPQRKSGAFGPVNLRFTVKRETVAMLFADLVGYSRLPENVIPYFIREFLGAIARKLAASGTRPIFKNVWGDALYFAFKESVAAAECALLLRDLMRTTDWQERRLPADLAMRIGLHAGPVFASREPILGRKNYFGSHVNEAARIEPVTSPGNVYASEAFAALLMTSKENRLDCRYVGVLMLPKQFGSFPIYHVKRRNEVD